ncbi:hypothetical protein [Bradyrhizobium sp.]|uniref:hypothetical protein n=1 Tax=unclassified Bradyrhizobium TaxID=2631580 RepID=UPI000A47BF13|nr:hypothetical protein [Bradyrhizobium sp.]
MLQYTQSAFSTTLPVRAHLSRKMSRTERVQYALAVIDGQRPLPRLTKATIARACGVSPSAVYHARSGQPRSTLASRLARAKPEELADIGRQLGSDWVWDKLIMAAMV